MSVQLSYREVNSPFEGDDFADRSDGVLLVGGFRESRTSELQKRSTIRIIALIWSSCKCKSKTDEIFVKFGTFFRGDVNVLLSKVVENLR